MTKVDVIKSVAEAAGITQVQAKAAYEQFSTLIVDTLAAGNTFQIPNVGTIKPVTRAARSGVSAISNQPWSVPERKSAAIKPSKTLLDTLN